MGRFPDNFHVLFDVLAYFFVKLVLKFINMNLDVIFKQILDYLIDGE